MTNPDDDVEYKVRKPNRTKARAPKRWAEWCPSCDRDLIWMGKGCKVCGAKVWQSREKK